MRSDRWTNQERVDKCYEILCSAANEGALCPQNELLSWRLGYASISGPAMLMRRMEKDGLIRVERFHQSRIVTITKTGAATAMPKHRKPHWRERRRQKEGDQRAKND